MEINYYQKIKDFVEFYKDILYRENYFYYKEEDKISESPAIKYFSEKSVNKIEKIINSTSLQKLNEEKIIKKIKKLNRVIFKEFDSVDCPLKRKTTNGFLEDAAIFTRNDFFDNYSAKSNDYNVGNIKLKCVMLSDEVGFFDKKEKEVDVWVAVRILNKESFSVLESMPRGKYKCLDGDLEFYITNKFFDSFIGFKDEEMMKAFFAEMENEIKFPMVEYEKMLEEGYLTNTGKVKIIIEKLSESLRDSKFSRAKKTIPIQNVPMKERKEIEEIKRTIDEFPIFKFVESEKELISVQNEFFNSKEVTEHLKYALIMMFEYTKVGSSNSNAVKNEVLLNYVAIIDIPSERLEVKIKIGNEILKSTKFQYLKDGKYFYERYEILENNEIPESSEFAKLPSGMYKCGECEILIGSPDAVGKGKRYYVSDIENFKKVVSDFEDTVKARELENCPQQEKENRKNDKKTKKKNSKDKKKKSKNKMKIINESIGAAALS